MLFVANTFFELEFEGKAGSSLRNALISSPIFKQLQYLPLLFLDPSDALLVTDLPPKDYLDSLESFGIKHLPSLVTFDEPSYQKWGSLESWGASNLVKQWGESKGLKCEQPSLDIAQRVNSKLENYPFLPRLKGGCIVFCEKDLLDVVEGVNHDWVVKTDQGFSGRGHCVFGLRSVSKAIAFCSSEWEKSRGVILEPWVERICDFSSQWFLSKSGEVKCIGVTKCLNHPSGIYMGTECGPIDLIFHPFVDHVEEHISFCKNYLMNISKLGYFGYLGFDAMIYKCSQTGRATLHPVVEVNARMTMSLALLLCFLRNSTGISSYFSFIRVENLEKGMLPYGYKRQLIIQS